MDSLIKRNTSNDPKLEQHDYDSQNVISITAHYIYFRLNSTMVKTHII